MEPSRLPSGLSSGRSPTEPAIPIATRPRFLTSAMMRRRNRTRSRRLPPSGWTPVIRSPNRSLPLLDRPSRAVPDAANVERPPTHPPHPLACRPHRRVSNPVPPPDRRRLEIPANRLPPRAGKKLHGRRAPRGRPAGQARPERRPRPPSLRPRRRPQASRLRPAARPRSRPRGAVRDGPRPSRLRPLQRRNVAMRPVPRRSRLAGPRRHLRNESPARVPHMSRGPGAGRSERLLPRSRGRPSRRAIKRPGTGATSHRPKPPSRPQRPAKPSGIERPADHPRPGWSNTVDTAAPPEPD